MFSNLKSGDYVYVGYGKRGIEGYHYRLLQVKGISPKKKWISVEGGYHFNSEGTSISENSSVHLELATPEFQEALRQKTYIEHTKYRMLGLTDITYDQAVKLNTLLDEWGLNHVFQK